MKSKIAVIHFGRKGAGPAIALEMARALNKQGHDIIYYASSTVENRKLVEAEPFAVRFFDTYKSKLTYLKSVLLPKTIRKVISSIDAETPDVVYSPMNDMWAPFIFPKLKHTLRVKTIHDVGVHEGGNSIVNKWWNKTNFKDAEKFIILSRKYVPKLLERGIDIKDIIVIPHAGFDYYAKIGSPSQCEGTGKQILFFGRIDQYKGLDILLDAMEVIIANVPDARLCIASNGDISKYKVKLEKLHKNIDLHIRWIKDEEVAGFVSKCDFILLPYTHATQSGVIPLAYAFAKPVVATDVGCLDEQIIDNFTGYLVPNRDITAIAAAAIDLLNNPDKAKLLGQNAQQFMSENLTWKAAAKIFSDFLHL